MKAYPGFSPLLLLLTITNRGLYIQNIHEGPNREDSRPLEELETQWTIYWWVPWVSFVWYILDLQLNMLASKKFGLQPKLLCLKSPARLAKQGLKHWASVRTRQPDITEQNCGLALPIPAKTILKALYLPLLDSTKVKAVVWWYQRRAKRVPGFYHCKLVMQSPFPHVISRDNEEPQSPPPVVPMWYSPCHAGAKASSRNRSIKQWSKSNANMRNPNCNWKSLTKNNLQLNEMKVIRRWWCKLITRVRF